MSAYDPNAGGHWGTPQPNIIPGAPGGYGPPPPPPSPRRNTTPIILGIIGVTVLILLLCTGGFITIRSLQDTPGTDSTREASPERSVGSSESASTTEEPTADRPSGPVVRPAGAPYSYTVPQGFSEVPPPSSSVNVGSTPKFPSAVAPAENTGAEFLIVTVYELSADADVVSESVLNTAFDDLVRRAKQDPSTRENLRVSGYRALKYQFNYGDSAAYSYFVFKGRTELQIRCQWKAQKPEIERGCDGLLRSLTIY